MPPIQQPTLLRSHQTLDRARLNDMIQAALHWREASGWPTKTQDLLLAAQLYARHRGPTEPETIHSGWREALARAMFDELSQRHSPEDVVHRHLLCLLIIEGASRGLGFNA